MSPQQLKVLDFVRDCGWSPTIADVATFTGSTVSQARAAIGALIVADALERGPKRALRLAGLPDVRTASSAVMLAELRRRGVGVPVARGHAHHDAGECAADGCREAIRGGHLMCRRHWFMLPDDLRRGLVRTSGAGETARFDQLLATAQAAIADARSARRREVFA